MKQLDKFYKTTKNDERNTNENKKKNRSLQVEVEIEVSDKWILQI